MISLPLQFERVRVIYKYALDRIPKHQAQELFKYYTMFEKKFGDRRGIEDVIVSKRRFQYEEEVKVFNGRKTVCDQWVVNITSCLHHFHYLFLSGKPTQLRRLVWLPSFGGEWCRPRHSKRGLWESHRQHAPHPGEETLETIHLPVDQLRSVRRAGGQGQFTYFSSSSSTTTLILKTSYEYSIPHLSAQSFSQPISLISNWLRCHHNEKQILHQQ